MWSSKDVCDDGPGINTFEEARLRNVVVYPHVNNCAAKPKASFGPARIETLPAAEASPLHSFYRMCKTCIHLSPAALLCVFRHKFNTVSCISHTRSIMYTEQVAASMARLSSSCVNGGREQCTGFVTVCCGCRVQPSSLATICAFCLLHTNNNLLIYVTLDLLHSLQL